MSNTYFQNKVLSDMQTLIRTLRCESGGSGNCCPETNNNAFLNMEIGRTIL
jgi:hypothetical protein